MTARIERGEDETDSEFALDERMGAAEVSVVVGLVLERFPDVAAGLFETDLFGSICDILCLHGKTSKDG